MSRERAHRRAAREVAAAAARRVARESAERDRARAAARRRRRSRWSPVRSLLLPAAPHPGRRRRTRSQRVLITSAVVAALALTGLLVEPWPLRIAVAALLLLFVPTAATAVLGRPSR